MTPDDRRRAWLIVHQAPGLGPSGLQALIEQDIDPASLPGRSRSELSDLGISAALARALSDPDPGRLEAALDWLDAPGHHLVCYDDPLYPPLLKRTSDAAPVLFVNGDPETLVAPQVAIVGSRSATSGGVETATRFATMLAKAGLVVTSGLAAGIDAAAHRATLAAAGRTIAVAGTGPDRVYPARHRNLAHEIVDNGSVITPFAPGVGPRPGHFPARNRIISGMALGTVVVEAGLRSGSLITARLAGEQGREVFAIPGSIHNPVARGCHRLIREGARLVEEPEEVIEALAPLAGELAASLRELLDGGAGGPDVSRSTVSASEPDPDVQSVLEAMGFDPTPVDAIIERSELTTPEVSSILMSLELEGRVQSHPGGRYSRAANETERNS